MALLLRQTGLDKKQQRNRSYRADAVAGDRLAGILLEMVHSVVCLRSPAQLLLERTMPDIGDAARKQHPGPRPQERPERTPVMGTGQ
jgi:hypothetical protein